MKKIIILILPLLLTGCFGKAGKGYLTDTCTKTEESNGFKSSESYVIDFKGDDITNVKIINNYEVTNDIGVNSLKAIKQTLISYNKSIKNMEGVTINIIEDNDKNIVIEYNIDYSLVSEENLEFFKLVKDYNTQINKLKELKMECR